MSKEKTQGSVHEYDPRRGYGVIKDSDEREYFVHYRELIEVSALKPGQQVNFEAILHRKGNLAHKVEVL